MKPNRHMLDCRRFAMKVGAIRTLPFATLMAAISLAAPAMTHGAHKPAKLFPNKLLDR